jgi:DNA-binding transcriptional regulator YiaG
MRSAQKKKRGKAKKRAKSAAKGTERLIGAEIIEGLTEAIAFERGEKTGAVFVAAPIGARQAKAEAAPDFSADDVVKVRKALKFSQTLFAQALNVSAETVRAWEQGKSPPSGPSKRLLEIAQKFPHVLKMGIVPTGGATRGRAVERRSGGDRRTTAQR